MSEKDSASVKELRKTSTVTASEHCSQAEEQKMGARSCTAASTG